MTAPLVDSTAAPKPNNAALLTFLDFVYAIILGDFCAIVVDKLLPEQRFMTLAYCAAVFGFVAFDWLHARQLTLRNPYATHRLFFIDLGIAFAAYAALTRAAHGVVSAAFYVWLMFVGGTCWAVLAEREHASGDDRGAFRLTARTHLVGVLSLASFFLLWFVLVPAPPCPRMHAHESEFRRYWHVLQWELGSRTPPAFVVTFVSVMIVWQLLEDLSRAYVLPKNLWFGPSAPAIIRRIVSRVVRTVIDFYAFMSSR